MITSLTYISVIVAIPFVLLHLSRRQTRRFPPGPRGLPLIGNLLDLPQDMAENISTFIKWREDYGDIMHMGGGGQHMIVLNTAQAASDLMNKRAAIYSNRPRMVMLHELVGNDWLLAIVSGETHRERRSMAQRDFFTSLRDWQMVQLETARSLLRSLFVNPNDWAALVRMSVASPVLRICYGHQITHPDEQHLKIVIDALDSPRNAPYLVDVVPLLKYYPSWLLGGGFKKDAAEAREISERLRSMPFDMVCTQMAAGTATPSCTATLMNQLLPDEDPKHLRQASLIRDVAAGIYVAAMDSSISSMYTFIGAMVLHPDIQRRAQSELDSVLGPDRLPTFEDRSQLPFIDCIVLEVLRFNVVTPLGLPHHVIEEDEYLGYQIPKGSTVLGNTWAILRDPEAFPNPDQFDPSRFLFTREGSARAREVLESAVFGWGNRICPGRHVGQSALFISFSHILTCFNIAKPTDDEGNEFEPSLKFYSKLFIRRALPTPCTIKPRSERIANLLAHPE